MRPSEYQLPYENSFTNFVVSKTEFKVSTRSASPDETRITDSEANGGQMRSLYSPNRISPHRMMHFGKRPVVSYAPAGLLELTADQKSRQRSQRSLGKPQGHFPYTLYFDVAPNRVLEPVLDGKF